MWKSPVVGGEGGLGVAGGLPGSLHPAPAPLPPLAVLFMQAEAPEPAGPLGLTFFHTDTRQNWQLLGSRTARNVISKCMRWIQMPGGPGWRVRCIRVSVQRGWQRCSCPAWLLGSSSPTPHVPQPPGRFASALPPTPPPRTPWLALHGQAITVTLLFSFFADNLLSGTH